MPCILASDGKLLVIPEKVKACKECKENLLNEENDWNKNLMVKVEGPCERISVEDVREALKLMNTGKIGAGGIKVALLEVCEKEHIKKLIKVAHGM